MSVMGLALVLLAGPRAGSPTVPIATVTGGTPVVSRPVITVKSGTPVVSNRAARHLPHGLPRTGGADYTLVPIGGALIVVGGCIVRLSRRVPAPEAVQR